MSAQTGGKRAAQAESSRQWIRLVAVYLLVPLILFVCGGDLGWWQAWLYALLIVTAGIGGRIWAEWRHPGLMAERQNLENLKTAKAWDKVLAPLMAVSVVYPMVIVAGSAESACIVVIAALMALEPPRTVSEPPR